MSCICNFRLKMPRLTENDLSKLPISDATRRLNPDLFTPGAVGRLAASKHGQPAGALERKAPKKRRRKGRPDEGPGYCITLIGFITRRMDDDNLAHAFKPMRDAIADVLGIDDGSSRLRWQYGQVETRGEQGSIAMIERMD